MGNHFIFILIFLGIFLVSCEKTEEDYLEDIEYYLREDNLDKALITSQEAKEKYTSDIDIYCYNAYLIGSTSANYSAARPEFEYILTLDSLNTYALYNLGFIEFQDSNFNKSITYLNKAIDSKGGPIFLEFTENTFIDVPRFQVLIDEIQYYKALSLYETNEVDSLIKAKHIYDSFISSGYERAHSFYMRSLVYNKLGHKYLACRDAKTALTMGYKDAQIIIEAFCN